MTLSPISSRSFNEARAAVYFAGRHGTFKVCF